jgi:hypothetical protein
MTPGRRDEIWPQGHDVGIPGGKELIPVDAIQL